MAYKYYKVGECKSGFVGFIVTGSKGCAKTKRSKTFSLRKHTYKQAKKLAIALDKEWREEAEEVKRLKNDLFSSGEKPNVIVTGFKCRLFGESGKKFADRKPRMILAFEVNGIPNVGVRYRSFRPDSLGYQEAYESAVDYYSDTRGLTEENRERLLTMIPDKTIFTDYLLDRLIVKGFSFTKEEVLELTKKKEEVEENKLGLSSRKPNLVVPGLRCSLTINAKPKCNLRKPYLNLMFEVEGVSKPRRIKNFRPKKLGYKKAYELAVEYYSSDRDLTQEETSELLTLIPSKEVFTDYLLNRLIANGHSVTEEEVLKHLEIA